MTAFTGMRLKNRFQLVTADAPPRLGIGASICTIENMSPTFIWTDVAALVVVLLAVFFAATYNRLVTLRQRYLNAYAQIDVQLKRRYDLIPTHKPDARGCKRCSAT